MVVLASASPRRRELLAQIGVAFEVRPADIDERVRDGEGAIAYVTRLAREKAEVVFRAAMEASGEAGGDVDGLVVLGADTSVVVDGESGAEILGKPVDAADAARMLGLLSGRTHRVVTGVAVVSAGRVEVAAEVTAVQFVTLGVDAIAAYVATGEPMGKAGGYAIQGMAARWIPRIDGCYFNVVGLPLALVTAMLEVQGLRE